MEMHLLLTPISLAVLSTLTMLVVLGLPHSVSLFVATRHLSEVARLCALVLALFPLWSAWMLGVLTLRGERYAFDDRFWMSLAASVFAAHLGFEFVSPLSPLALLPIWLFIAHMSVLQFRLRRRPRAAAADSLSALGLP